MKYVVAINASPRTGWNTAMLVKKAAEGAEAAGAQVDYFDLYQSEAFTGCISCFGCKREGHLGRCIHKDGLSPILEAIENDTAYGIHEKEAMKMGVHTLPRFPRDTTDRNRTSPLRLHRQ